MAPSPARQLHPRHGTHQPTRGTPARRPSSARRTSTVDMLRPDGLVGPDGRVGDVVVDARARDLRTGPDGEAEARDETRVTAEIDYAGGWTLKSLASEPVEPRLAGLIGASAGGGFRRRVQADLPDQYAAATRLHLLLDDFPVATLVSGYSLGAGGIHPDPEALVGMARADLCSGWRSGGTIMVSIQRERTIPIVTGPEAPGLESPAPMASEEVLENGSDADAWHDRPPLSPHAMRRARRLDVWLADGVIELDSLFRDSHVDADGLETVIHEYTVRGQVDPEDFTIRALVATPQVLPWVECPSAVASAGRLIGQDVRTLRPLVRAGFKGISTCTHLNDQLRELADLPALL